MMNIQKRFMKGLIGMLSLIIAFVIGGIIGWIVSCLCVAAGDDGSKKFKD